jgi:hypothetical protein
MSPARQRPIPALARALRFAVAADPVHRFHIIPGGLRIVPLLLGGIERRIVATLLLRKHAVRIVSTIRAEALAGPAVCAMRSATPVDLRRSAIGDAYAQQRGEHERGTIAGRKIVTSHS